MNQILKRKRKTLKDREKIVRFMSLPENKNESTSQATFHKLAKSPSKGGVGIDRRTLRRWWGSRDRLDQTSKKTKRFRVDNIKTQAFFPEIEEELSNWIKENRYLGCCLSGFVIRVKSLELSNEKCSKENVHGKFKASVGWLLKFLKRNKWVSRRITSSGRDLPENSIETIIDFFVKMKAFSNENEVEFDSIINMDETCVYLDFPSNNTCEKKV